MSNTFFEMHSSPEKYNQVYDDYLRLTAAELRALNATKSRIYVSLDDIEIIQNALQSAIETAERLNGTNVDQKAVRRMVQMGYSLEEIKYTLKKKIAAEERRQAKEKFSGEHH